jgi:hypothetical protein
MRVTWVSAAANARAVPPLSAPSLDPERVSSGEPHSEPPLLDQPIARNDLVRVQQQQQRQQPPLPLTSKAERGTIRPHL